MDENMLCEQYDRLIKILSRFLHYKLTTVMAAFSVVFSANSFASFLMSYIHIIICTNIRSHSVTLKPTERLALKRSYSAF